MNSEIKLMEEEFELNGAGMKTYNHLSRNLSGTLNEGSSTTIPSNSTQSNQPNQTKKV